MSFPARDTCDGYYRSLRQQHGHGGTDKGRTATSGHHGHSDDCRTADDFPILIQHFALHVVKRGKTDSELRLPISLA